jgi:four helix bundle protein
MSERFPQKETYALTSQLRRSAMSVPANIAEGFKKRGVRDKLRYYNIAQGSLEESRYYFILARDLGYVAIANEMERLEEVSRLLESYCRTLLNSEF